MSTNGLSIMKGQPFEQPHLTVKVFNPAQPNLCWEGKFRVDYDAVDSIVPSKYLEAISLLSWGNRRRKTANGKDLYLNVTGARLEFLDEVVGASIIVVDDDIPPVLGRTALISARIEEDPQTGRLMRRSAGRLQGGFKSAGPKESARQLLY